MYSRVVLLKSNGISQGFETIAAAMAAADANSLINVYPGAHAVASSIVAKSNVTINLVPGATVTFAERIQIGTDITNFKIVGDGNVVFTGRAFELIGIVGSGNEIRITGNVTVGLAILFTEYEGVQTNHVAIIARNITVTGEVFGGGLYVLGHDTIGGNNLQLVLLADEVMTVPCLAISPVMGNTSLTATADRIVCNGNGQQNFAVSLTIRARLLALGNNTNFSDPDSNTVTVYFEIDEILQSTGGSGIFVNGAINSLTFKKHVRIKNTSATINSCGIDGSNDLSNLVFQEGAVIYVAAATGVGIKGDGSVISNRNIISNKGFDNATITGGGAFITDEDCNLLY